MTGRFERRRATGRVGRRRARGRVVVAANDVVTLLQAPEYFAPGTENCRVRYGFRRGRAGTRVSMVIKDKDNREVYRNNLLGLAADRSDVFNWDGKDNSGHYVTHLKSPYTVSIEFDSGFSMGRQVKVEIGVIALWTRDAPKLYMNVPDSHFDSAATVMFRNSTGGHVVTPVPVDVEFSFSDPGNNNATQGASFQYQNAPAKYLGKGGSNLPMWQAYSGYQTQSADSFQTKCVVKVDTSAGRTRGKAYVKFKPAAVGGDNYKLKATVFADDGSTVLKAGEGSELVVWRDVSFNAYQMVGQAHITTHGTVAKMRTYYTDDTFVRYRLGSVTAISATFSVDYIGLWNRATQRQRNWTQWQRKTAAETPTANEIRDANGPAGAARNAARTAIQAKADAWMNRIINDYDLALARWAVDAGIPINSILAIGYEHPKYSSEAPDADSLTSEWSQFPWLQITVEDETIHPDDRWVLGMGVSIGNRAYITRLANRLDMETTIAHEIGHETKNQFKRDSFGNDPTTAGDDDHTQNGRGLMDPWGRRNRFTANEKRILRGFRR